MVYARSKWTSFEKALEGNKSLKELSESYLGFVVIKPIKDKDIDGSFLNF